VWSCSGAQAGVQCTLLRLSGVLKGDLCPNIEEGGIRVPSLAQLPETWKRQVILMVHSHAGLSVTCDLEFVFILLSLNFQSAIIAHTPVEYQLQQGLLTPA
jgi:hypothetical protein